MVLRRRRGPARDAQSLVAAIALRLPAIFLVGARSTLPAPAALDLPGTSGVHDPDDRATYHWVVFTPRPRFADLLPAMHKGLLDGNDAAGLPRCRWLARTPTRLPAVERRVLSPRACVLVIDNLMPV